MQRGAFPQPISLVSVAALPDRDRLVQWEQHLRPLCFARMVTFWSELHLLAGDRREQLAEQVDQADYVILLLSSDFFADDACCALMQRALARQQQRRILLLLLRPVDWQSTRLGDFVCLPANQTAVTLWENVDEAWCTCVQDLCSLLTLPASPAVAPAHPPPGADASRTYALRILRRSYATVLHQELGGLERIALGLSEKPDAVQNATTNLAWRSALPKEQPLPAGTSIARVYERSQGELLLLGEAGAGKSTLLYLLAEQLAEQAERDERTPPPIVPVALILGSQANQA